MKYLFLIVTLMFLSCELLIYEEIPGETQYIYPEEEPSPGSNLIGKWYRSPDIIEFYDIGDFVIYDSITLIESNYGFYIDSGDSVYLEDPMQFESMTYYYRIEENKIIGEIYSVSLIWNTFNGPDIEWVKIE